MRAAYRFWILPAGIVAAMLLSIPAADLYYRTSRGTGCARCHEISFDYNLWSQSAHRKINCVECHASGMKTNVRRVAAHIQGAVPDQVHLGADGISAMMPACRKCHEQEFAQWSASAHSTTYAAVITDRDHNGKRVLSHD